MNRALIIFIKNPVKGKVKTRLAADVGEDKALLVYKHLLDHTREITIPVKATRLLFYEEEINLYDNWSTENFSKYIQQGDDLGEKMLHAFETAFSLGNTQVLIIGSDCMELDSKMIQKAFDELNDHDFVIGPAKDGGYYLLGMKAPHPSLFLNKTWSHSGVFNNTMNAIRDLDKTCSILPELSDIDTIADLTKELQDLIR